MSDDLNDGSSFIRAKQSTKPAFHGWAPGWYVGKCNDCGCYFQGDKRAYQCADCAYGTGKVKRHEAGWRRRILETSVKADEAKSEAFCDGLDQQKTETTVYGIRQQQRDGSYRWLSRTGHFVEDTVGSCIATFSSHTEAIYTLYLQHAAASRNCDVVPYPATGAAKLTTIDLSPINRVELIDHTKTMEGRAWVRGSIYGSPVEVELDVQDEGRTLKIFVRDRE